MTRLAALTLALVLSGCGSLVPDARTPAKPQMQAPRPVAASGEQRQCLADLGTKGARFSPVADRYYGAGCSTLGSVNLTGVSGDIRELQLTNLGPVACPLAETTAAWARFGVDRAARLVFGSPLARIETFGSYSCRDVAGSGRRSAHATANAIDVSAFVLADGRRVSVLADWTGGDPAKQRFLRLVHQSACKRFGTVLGPDYNAAHKDHFHVESGRQGGFCR